MTLREILKKKGITYKVVSDALGIHPNNMPRYDDLMKRVEEIITISKATGIEVSELIGFSLPKQSEEFAPITNERLLSIIESQQRTIENLSKK
ncbi:helix-turn-helix domain-containing protein [Parabacteroides goldsteinii]|uniref:helix-turn-helix domain-containing protein n=1 Tax=Parabacteroides goldsteinii TaxID=328812 RepID=UPI00256EF114|nr:helix-turn-helix transcriptional regulator [Parabacteroides goldsteinii]